MTISIAQAVESTIVGEIYLQVITGFNGELNRVAKITNDNAVQLSELVNQVASLKQVSALEESKRIFIETGMFLGNSEEEAIFLHDALMRNELVFYNEQDALDYASWNAQEKAKAQFKKEDEQASAYNLEMMAQSLGSHDEAIKVMHNMKNGKMTFGEDVEDMIIVVRGR